MKTAEPSYQPSETFDGYSISGTRFGDPQNSGFWHIISRSSYGELSQSEFLVEGLHFKPAKSTTHEQGPPSVRATATGVIVPRQERAAVLKAIAYWEKFGQGPLL